MANNLINASELLEKINTLWSEHAKLINQANEPLQKYTNLAKLPSNYAKNLQEVTDVSNKLRKSTDELTKTEKQLQAQQKADIVLRNKRIKAFEKQDKAIAREQKALERTSGLYNKVQAGINSLTRQYNDLALKKELNGRLTSDEVIKLGSLEAKLNKYQKALLNVDKQIGKHGRNVGNYKSGFDGLGFSVAQLSREMPAFANSMQTGFMAISNNIPMLTDEINKLKIANRELADSGKPTVNIFKSLGKAIFSWHTLISVGVTLLTVYGAKLFEAIFPTDELRKATEKQNKELEEQNKNLRENIALRKRQIEDIKGFVNNSQIVDQFKGILSSVMSDSKQAEAVLTELAERINKIGVSDTKALTDQNIIQSDRVQMAFNMLEIEKQNIALQEERIDLDAKLRTNEEIKEKLKDKSLGQAKRQQLINSIEVTDLGKTIKIQERINQLKDENLRIIGKTVELDGGDKSGSGSSERAKILQVEAKKTKALSEIIREHIKVLTDARDMTLGGSQEYAVLTKEIEKYNDILNGTIRTTDLLLDSEYLSRVKSAQDGVKAREEAEKKKTEITAYYAKKREEIEREVEQNVRELINASVDAMFQKKLDNYEREGQLLNETEERALSNTQLSEEAQIEIKRQAQVKRDELARKQAETERKAFLLKQAFEFAEITISTIKAVAQLKAQASILASNPITAPLASIALSQIPLVITSGAIAGATVLAQTIPAFKDGVIGFEGGQAIVGDGGKHEYIRTPDGTVTKTPKTDTLVNLPKGTDVFKDENAFMNSLNKELGINGISPLSNILSRSIMPNITNKGISKEDLKEVFSNEISKLNNTIKNKPETSFNFDEKGFNAFITSRGGKTKVLNARVTGRGKTNR